MDANILATIDISGAEVEHEFVDVEFVGVEFVTVTCCDFRIFPLYSSFRYIVACPL